MSEITIAGICTAIKNSLSGIEVDGVPLTVKNYDELAEGVQDCPLAQIYWNNVSTSDSDTDMLTLEGGVRSALASIVVDVYVSPRNQLDENIADVTKWFDAIWTHLWDNTNGGCGNFGLSGSGLRSITWAAQRVTLISATTEYAGIRFEIECIIF